MFMVSTCFKNDYLKSLHNYQLISFGVSTIFLEKFYSNLNSRLLSKTKTHKIFISRFNLKSKNDILLEKTIYIKVWKIN